MRSFLLVPIISLFLSVAVIAQQKGQDEQPLAETVSPNAATPASGASDDPEKQVLLDELIDELGSPRFAIRLQAARKLKAAGAEAIEQLRRVTKTGEKETASQALKILEEHLENENNEALQTAAKNALKEIAKDPNNSSSSEAKGILSKSAGAQTRQNQQNLRLPIAIPRNLRAAAMRVQVQNNNGKIRIQVEKNGQKTSITEDEEGIKVEKKDANGKSTKKTYKNVDELKQKDKDAHQIFQQYKKVGGGIQIQVKGNGLPLRLNVRPKNIPNLKPAVPKGASPKNLDNLQKQTLKQHRDMMELQLRKMQEDILKNVPKEHRKQLEDQFKKQMEIMNRPLRELEQKLEQEKPKDDESKVPDSIPAPADKKPADSNKKPVRVETVEQELIET